MRLVPLSERGSVDLNNSALGQSFGSDQLVVARVVHYIDDSRLSGDTFGAPREVTGVQTKRTVLFVSTTSSDRVDTLRAQFRVGRRSAQLELPLLSWLWSFATSGTSFMPVISGDTFKKTSFF